MENTTQTSITSAPLTSESSPDSGISSVHFAGLEEEHPSASFSDSIDLPRVSRPASSRRARADTAGTGTATQNSNSGPEAGRASPSEESPVQTPTTEVSQPMLVHLSDVDLEMQPVQPRAGEKRRRRLMAGMMITRETWTKVGSVALGLIIAIWSLYCAVRYFSAFVSLTLSGSDPAGSALAVVFGIFCLISALSVAIPLVLTLAWSRPVRDVLPLSAYKMLYGVTSFVTVLCALVNVVLVACHPPANACHWDLDGLWVPMRQENAACTSNRGVRMGVAVARLLITLVVVVIYVLLNYALLPTACSSSPMGRQHDLEEGLQTELGAPLVTTSTHVQVEKKYSDSSFSAILERLRLKRIAQPTPVPTTTWSGSTYITPSSGSGSGSNWVAPWGPAPGSSGGRTPTPPTPAYQPQPIWAGRRVTPPPLPRPSGSTDGAVVPSLSSQSATPLLPSECAAAGVIRPLSMMRSNSGSSVSHLRAKRLAGHSRSSSVDKNATVSSASSRLIETRRSSTVTENAVAGPSTPGRVTEESAPSRKYGYDVHPYRLSAFSDTSFSISVNVESPSTPGGVPLSRANSYASSHGHRSDVRIRDAPSRPQRDTPPLPYLRPSSPTRLPIPAYFALASTTNAPYFNITSPSENLDDFGRIPIAGGFVRPLSPIDSFGSRGDLLSVPSDPSSRANTLSSSAALSSLAFASGSDPSRSARSRRSARSTSTTYLSVSVSSAATGGTFGTFGRVGPESSRASRSWREHGNESDRSSGRGRRQSEMRVDEQGQLVDPEGNRRSFMSAGLESHSRSASRSRSRTGSILGSTADSLSDDALTFETPPPGPEAVLPLENECEDQVCMTVHETTIIPGGFDRTYAPHDEDDPGVYH